MATCRKELPRSGCDEKWATLHALEDMRTKLRGIVTTVRANAETVATASSEIAQGNTNLSQRTEEQASALEETAATMDELASTVRNNADNAQQAKSSSRSVPAMWPSPAVKSSARSSRPCAASTTAQEDCRHHWRDRRHRLPDQHPGAERGGGSRPRRRAGGVALRWWPPKCAAWPGRSADAAKEIKSLISASVERVELGTAQVDKAAPP